MMKRIFAATVAAAFGLGLLFSSQGVASDVFELNMGSLAPRGTPWMDQLEKMETQIEADTNGKINVILRPPGVMAEVEMVRETRRGERLQGAGVTTAALAEGGNIPQLSLVELPFLFNTNEEADHVLDTLLWNEMGELLKRRGFILAVWSENGWRSFATKGDSIKVPADLKKFKMRSQEAEVHMAMYNAFGGQAIQKPMTEVLTSLQSNVIDGLDNTALYIQAGVLAEPLDYFTMSRHIYQPAAIVYSRKFFDGLPQDLQAILMKPKALTESGRVDVREEERAMMENFEIFNVEVIELSDAERNEFAKVCAPVHDEFASTVDGGPELLGKIRKSLEDFRAK
jgi:TRAP-type transport system periplasmic protein